MSIIKRVISYANSWLVYFVLVVWFLLFIFSSIKFGYVIGIAISIIPISIIIFASFVKNPFWAFIVVFIANFTLSGLSRYLKVISPGITMDLIIVITIVTLLLNLLSRNSALRFDNARNGLTFLAIIWFLYCLFQIFNPNSSSIIAWLTGVRSLGIYFVIIVFMTSIFLDNLKRIRQFLFLWAVLSLLAVLKAYIQKTYGFDSAELRFLFVEGGSNTHILYYGIRYFSFFTDAGNFGTGMAFYGVVFGIYSLYVKDFKSKVFFLITALACAYGMIISGTRGSLAVPFAAFTLFSILSKKSKLLIFSLSGVLIAFIFLNYTTYGQGNTYIRRMRSAFNSNDPSLIVRLENQQKLRTYMWDKPFGVGIGMSLARNIVDYKPDPFVSKIPSDSWYVRVWLEIGIVGLIIHIINLLFIVVYGAYLVYFKIKNTELKGLITAFVCGLSGVYVAAYSLEIIGQFPTSFIMFLCMTLIFRSKIIDNELETNELSIT